MSRLFQREELKLTKHQLIRHGYSPEEAQEEVKNMMELAKENHDNAIGEERRKKMKEKRYKKGRFSERYRKLTGVKK